MQSPTIIINFKLSVYKRLKQTSWADPKILSGTNVVNMGLKRILSELKKFENYVLHFKGEYN